jgi:diguanylate cyclase (GGDEF)-like protein
MLPEGEVRWVHARGQVEPDAQGRAPRVQGTVQDVSDQKRAERELLARARQQAAVASLGQLALEGGDLTALMQKASELVADVLDVEFTQVVELRAEPAALLLRAGVGWREDAVGHATLPVGLASQAGYALDPGAPVVLRDAHTGTRFPVADLWAQHGVKSGVAVTIHGQEAPFGFLGADTASPRTFSTQDIDFLQSVANVLATAIERHRAGDRLAQQALHDPLTGLPNRALVMDRLSQALARAHRRESSLAVFFLDLDRFKVVNDGLGHSAGDELLVAVASRLRSVVRPADTVARLGGDEFVVVSEDVPDGAHAATLARRIADVLNVPVTVAGREVPVTASIGMVLADRDHDTPESLVRDADVAMYRAKERGRARCELFDTTMRDRVTERLETEGALRRALEREELCVVYQPEFSLRDGSLVGVEALLRWEHPERGLLRPSQFLPLAEDTGLIVPMGTWALAEACRQASAWRDTHGDLGSLVVWVNFSARQLMQPDIPDIVADIVQRTLGDPSHLGIEITESVLMDDIDAAGSALRRLKQLGVQLAIDDFGTGFSSLSYLKQFPVGVLKVDRSFVRGLETDADDGAIVRAVIGLAHSLGLVAVAEGVKTAEQLRTLRLWGCDVAQGYHLGEPADALAIDEVLRANDEVTRRRRVRHPVDPDRVDPAAPRPVALVDA